MADELGARITQQIQNLRLARELFPSWVETGFEDYSCTIHSYGISFWTALGQAMGYEAICELPAPSNGRYSAIGDDVRSDSAWFDRQSGEPILLVEFERYDGLADKDKLMRKVESLLLAHHRWGQRAPIALSYWTRGLCDPPDHAMLADRFRAGYHTSAMERVEGGRSGTLLIYQFLLRECEFRKWRLWQIRDRGAY